MKVPKVLIAAVFLIAALYLCGAGGSLANFDADPDGLYQTFEDVLGSANPVNLNEISGERAGCKLNRAAGQFIIQEGRDCIFEVSEAVGLLGTELKVPPVRSLKMRVDTGDRIALFQEVERDNRPSVDMSAFPKKPGNREVTLNFYEEGGSFRVTCGQGDDDGACVIALNP